MTEITIGKPYSYRSTDHQLLPMLQNSSSQAIVNTMGIMIDRTTSSTLHPHPRLITIIHLVKLQLVPSPLSSRQPRYQPLRQRLPWPLQCKLVYSRMEWACFLWVMPIAKGKRGTEYGKDAQDWLRLSVQDNVHIKRLGNLKWC
jgi:hypothetical protein